MNSSGTIGRQGETKPLSMVLFVVIVVLNTRAAPTRAGGPGGTFVVEIEGHVREVFPAQWLLIMDDGTALRAQDPHQLDGLREGVKLRIRCENRDGATNGH